MCRFIIFHLRNKNELFSKLLNALLESAKYDPILNKMGRKPQHPDGWGYVVYEGDTVAHYKSLASIYEDTENYRTLIQYIESHFPVVGLIHVRKASEGMSINLNDVQPIHFITNKGEDVWVIHNGTLITRKLPCKKGIELDKVRSDTTAFTICLSEGNGEDLSNFIRKVVESDAVKTALNLGMMIQSPKGKVKAY